MSDITGFAKMNPLHGRAQGCAAGGETGFEKARPSSFKDELNALMAEAEGNCQDIVNLFKDNIRRYVKEHGANMTERSVEFPIQGGKIYNMLPETFPATICDIESLPSVKAAFGKEGIALEWAYDRGRLNGKLVFRW